MAPEIPNSYWYDKVLRLMNLVILELPQKAGIGVGVVEVQAATAGFVRKASDLGVCS
jgi:hypothetical protein